MGKKTTDRFVKKIPLRHILIVSFVIPVVLVAGLVGYLSFRNGQQAVNEVAQQLRGEINARISEHLYTFLATPHQINRLNATAISQRQLTVDDPIPLEHHFWQQVQVFDSVSSIYFGNTSGGMVDAGREGPAGSLYVIVTDGFARGPFRKYATDGRGNRTDLLATVPDFDARTRPWYTDAEKNGKATWSEVYILFTGQDMAIAASRPVYDEQNRLLGVVSVDIFLSQLDNFLKSIEIGKTGQSFIIDRSGLLIASSTDERPFITLPGEDIPQRLNARDSRLPLVRAAAVVLTDRFGPYQTITTEHQLDFMLDQQRQFLQVSPVQDEYGLDWLIVTVMPEADFMAQVNANNRTTIALSGVAALVAIVLGIIMAWRITLPILRLNASAQDLAKGKWTQGPVHNGWIAETSGLTQSFTSMARQLQQMLEDLTAEITERRHIEAALRKSEERFRLLFANAPDATFLADIKTGTILNANAAAARLLQKPIEAITGTHFSTLHPPEISESSREKFSRHASGLETGECPVIEHMVIRADGQTVPVEVTAGIFEFNQQKQLLGVFRDITERKQAEAERERLIDELQTALTQVKQLSGLLPICASCKKIRDDKGYWQQIEVYIREHSAVDFSHGICPECMEKLYPKEQYPFLYEEG